MNLLSSINASSLPSVISIAGGGGKTSTMFALGELLRGQKVLLTTTTKILRPPLSEKYEIVESDYELKLCDKKKPVVFGIPSEEYPGKLTGCSLDQLDGFKDLFDFMIIESDGSAGRPIKAPASHEPVIFPLTELYIGVIGLDCLGKKGDDNTVHRPELFAGVRGKEKEEPITKEDLILLINHREGLFKNASDDCRKVVLLNKADLLGFKEAKELTEDIASSMNNPGTVILNSYHRDEPVLLSIEKV